MTPRGPSPARCTPSARISSCTPRRGRCVADAQALGKNATWRCGGSTRGATCSSTGVRQRRTTSRARAGRRASTWAAAKRESTGALCASGSTGASSPPGSPSWKRDYRRRAALERINARLDRSFEFERHFLRGLPRMHTRAGLALSVMMALALGHVRAGHPERMRSLYGPVPPASVGQALGRHRLTGWFRPKPLPVRSHGPEPAPAKAGGRLVRVARTGAFCPCTKARCGSDRAPSHRLQRSARPSGVRRTAPKSRQHTCLRRTVWMRGEARFTTAGISFTEEASPGPCKLTTDRVKSLPVRHGAGS